MDQHDFMKKLMTIVSEAKAPDLAKAGQKAIKNIKKNEAEKKAAEKTEKADVKASNVKESGAEFFRKYSDLIKEAETVTEGKMDDFNDAKAAKKEADADDYKKPWEKKKDSSKREVKGSKYGGSKQKDEEDLTEATAPVWFFRSLAFAARIAEELGQNGQQFSTKEELLAAAEQLVAKEYGAKKANTLFTSEKYYELPEQIIDVYNDAFGTEFRYGQQYNSDDEDESESEMGDWTLEQWNKYYADNFAVTDAKIEKSIKDDEERAARENNK